jgi:putative endonuclease
MTAVGEERYGASSPSEGPSSFASARAALGRTGEEYAARLLERAGYRILDRNWRDGRREIDLVALWGTEVVFVEVKTRRPGPQSASEALTTLQRRRIRQAAAAWLRCHPGVGATVRFDLVALTVRAGRPPAVRHVAGAFCGDEL